MDDKLLRDGASERQEVVFDVGRSSSQVGGHHTVEDPLYQEKPTDGSSTSNSGRQFPETFGIESSYAVGSAKPAAAKPNKKKERITIGVLCVALLVAIIILVVLAILLACKSGDASTNDLAATAMLSSSPKGLTAGGAESRALLRASEIAAEIGQESLVLAPLAEAVSALARAPFWQFDIKQHTGRVSSVAFAPASVPGSSSTARLLTAGSWDSTIKITRVELPGGGDALLPEPNMPSLSVNCSGEGRLHSLAWSPSGEWLAAGCGTRDALGNSTATVHLWSVGPSTPPGTPDLPKLTKVAEMKHDNEVKALAWAPDSSALAAGDDDGDLRVWLVDAATDNAKGFEPEYVNLEHYGGNDIRALSWSPDGRVLASGRTDENIFLWDVTDLSDDGPWIMAKGEAHDGDIDAVAFSPDGRMLASADDEGQVLLWDVRNLFDRFPKKVHWTPQQGEDYDDDDFVDALPSLEMVHELPEHEDHVTGIVWTSSDAVATSSNDGTVRIYDIMVPVARAGNLTVTGAVRVSLSQPATAFENLAYVDTSPPLLAAGTNSGLTLGWREAEDLGLGGPESFPMRGCSAELSRKFSEERLSVRGSAHTEDGLRFAISTYQGNVCIWERSLSAATAGPTFGWKLKAALEITGADKSNVPCRYIEFSPSGNMLAAATDKNGVHTWRRDPNSGSWEAHHEHYHTGKVKKVAWSPDEKFLASGSMDQSVAVVEVVDKAASKGANKTTPELLERHSAPVQAVAWHGTLDGGDLVLASGSDDTTIGLWRLERGPGGSVQVKSISIVKHHDGVGVHHLAWAPGKDWLASVGGTGKITVLEGAAKAAQGDATDSTPVVATFNAGAGGLDAMSWNPDGTKIAVALPDNSVRVWTLGDSGRGASTWRLEESCKTMRWLVPTGKSPERLACARLPNSDDIKPGMESYDYLLQYILVNFEDQLTYLRRLTFGKLSADDISMLGLQDMDAVTAHAAP